MQELTRPRLPRALLRSGTSVPERRSRRHRPPRQRDVLLSLCEHSPISPNAVQSFNAWRHCLSQGKKSGRKFLGRVSISWISYGHRKLVQNVTPSQWGWGKKKSLWERVIGLNWAPSPAASGRTLAHPSLPCHTASRCRRGSAQPPARGHSNPMALFHFCPKDSWT